MDFKIFVESFLQINRGITPIKIINSSKGAIDLESSNIDRLQSFGPVDRTEVCQKVLFQDTYLLRRPSFMEYWYKKTVL